MPSDALAPDDMLDGKELIKLATEAASIKLDVVAETLYKIKARDSRTQNVKNLGNKAKQNELALTYAFLMNTEEKDEEVTKFNMIGLQNMIMNRVKQLMPVGCPKCNQVYVNERQGAPQVTCRMCGVGACPDCFSSEERKNRWTFLCRSCDKIVTNMMGEEALEKKCFKADKKKKKTKTTLEEAEEVIIEEDNGDDDLEEGSWDEEVGENLAENASQDAVPKNDSDKEEKKMPICYHFKRGKCRHGLSGKKSVDGKEKCPFRHPKICGRLLRNGDRGRGGCRGERDGCQEYHDVKMCFSSMNTRKCPHKECKNGYHIKGTVMVENVGKEAEMRDEAKSQPKVTPWEQTTEKQAVNDNNVPSFLGQMLLQQQELMHQMQKRADQQRAEQMQFQQQMMQMIAQMGGTTGSRPGSNQVGAMQQQPMQPLTYRQVV